MVCSFTSHASSREPVINTPCMLTMHEGQCRPQGESASGEASERHGNDFQSEAPATNYATDCNLAERVCADGAQNSDRGVLNAERLRAQTCQRYCDRINVYKPDYCGTDNGCDAAKPLADKPSHHDNRAKKQGETDHSPKGEWIAELKCLRVRSVRAAPICPNQGADHRRGSSREKWRRHQLKQAHVECKNDCTGSQKHDSACHRHSGGEDARRTFMRCRALRIRDGNSGR